ncbi:MAG: sigma 54-interacting transcriptional regulator [Desulfobacterales bacterium]|jgi:DNA-binding NtrC family response regulator
MGTSAPAARLTAEERGFFALINQAAFANPFSEEREALDRRIAGLPPEASQEAALAGSIARIRRMMDRLEREGRARIDRFAGRDRRLVENAFLYDFFHRFLDRFDRLIVEQAAAGADPLPVGFADEAFALLGGRGFDRRGIRRYFEVVYQLRRAFFFIDRSLVGCSPSMRRLRKRLWDNVFTHDLDLYNRHLWDRMEDFSVLILGETGAGKGAAAAAIGRSGFIPFDEKKGRFAASFTGSFLELNLSQYPENLIESELFGHRKGAFTGAVEDHRGAFDRCSRHGAIFLDEIGEVSIPVQIKLLRVLQERTYAPVGSHEQRRFEGRIIAATNVPLSRLRSEGRMRDDFFYRLCTDVITVPPLRQRIAEDPCELDSLLSFVVERLLGRPSEEVVKMVRTAVDARLGAGYPWPGNVRELEQFARRTLINRGAGAGRAEAPAELSRMLADQLQSGAVSAQELMSGYCFLVYERSGTYEETARRLALDRRTVKKYVEQWQQKEKPDGGSAV